ncbi:hypothetical protein [Lentzea sp. NPDC051838]|uniref:hypothetical protein n=1 Tax=Lentzea sp. NPDC051838 TaxID=3154849 RepID=UPI003427D753
MMPNQGWQQNQPPQQQWGPPPPQQPRGGSFVMAIIVAVAAAGVAVYWAILGYIAIAIGAPHKREPELIASLLVEKGGNGSLLAPLSIAELVLKLLTAVVLLVGALLIILRKVPGAFLVAGAVLLAVLSAGCRFVYYNQIGWSGTSDTYIATVLTLIVGVLAILPPVTKALKPAAQQQFGHPQGGQFPPQQQFPQQQFPPQGPPPGYGPPQGPPPPGYGPPR